jgi:regulation of enolase protein 1 (concanavalin A-like superfamily)
MQTPGPVDLGSFGSSAPAIVWSSFNGEREGFALADVLLGKYNPSGHLPFTWYQNESDLPSITNYSITPGSGSLGRTYMYYRGPVSYPFGYGLSYTNFSVSGLSVTPTHPTADDTLRTSVDVTNTGSIPGDDLVQLYVATPGVSGLPLKRLDGFQQIYLNPGQTGVVTITVPVANLAFWAGDRFAVRDGTYQVQIASSAAPGDVLAAANVAVSGRLTPVPRAVNASPQMPGDSARGIKQRLLFPVGTVVEPRLSVSMNDQSLYRDSSLPAGARVSYSSNNPKVVSVTGSTIRTIANGVATVTAAVTYHKVTAYGQFVVRAISELGGITFTFKRSSHPRRKGAKSKPSPSVPLPGFEPDILSYDETVPLGKLVPRLSASTPDTHAHVRIAQAPRVPGVAHIAVTGPDGITLTYTVNFARPAQSLAASQIGPQWTWIRQDPANESASGGGVQITLEPGNLDNHSAHNVLVEPAFGDWTITSRLTLSSLPTGGQQAGIMAYQDDDNYLKLAWEGSQGGPLLVLTTTDDLSGTTTSQVLAFGPLARSTVWLRMVRRGPHYAAYYSFDGMHYAGFYSVGADLSDVKVGLFAFNSGGTSNGPTASFGFFAVKNSNVAALH